tara:strand:+ start:237 stop:467 length:231 start_codon:yes stop_codon:yes gene_type:complete
MAVLTTIAGVPLYSTIQEAVAWANAQGLSGYHTHGWQGQTGYMGGSSHSAATQALSPTMPTVTTTSSSGGGGGGGY